jgi:hypothetical protein
MQPGMADTQFPNKETHYCWAYRAVRVRDLTRGLVDLNAYPFRYLTIYEYNGYGGRAAVFAVLEYLEQFDWELVNGFTDETNAFTVLIRRVLRAGQTEQVQQDQPPGPPPRPQDIPRPQDGPTR